MMTFENFRTNYAIDRKNAVITARIFGVALAQVQMWVIQIAKGK